MVEYKTRKEFAQGVSDWCKKASSFYNSNQDVRLSQLPAFIDEVKELESQRDKFMHIIRTRLTKLERDEFTEAYKFRMRSMDLTYELHTNLITSLKK